MAAMLQLEAIGPRGEELAMAAGDATGIPTGSSTSSAGQD
jgi:hypothetical protein